MSRRDSLVQKPIFVGAILTLLVCLLVTLAVIFLYWAPSEDQASWSNIGQALGGIGTLFSGLALIAVVATLAQQNRQLMIAQDDRRAANALALRQMHVDIRSMAFNDHELADVWPPISPGRPEAKTDLYINLILYLQSIAFDLGAMGEVELTATLRNLMTSDKIYDFWTVVEPRRAALIRDNSHELRMHALIDDAYRFEAARRQRAESGA